MKGKSKKYNINTEQQFTSNQIIDFLLHVLDKANVTTRLVIICEDIEKFKSSHKLSAVRLYDKGDSFNFSKIRFYTPKNLEQNNYKITGEHILMILDKPCDHHNMIHQILSENKCDKYSYIENELIFTLSDPDEIIEYREQLQINAINIEGPLVSPAPSPDP
jgi:hypothetical protein